MAGIWIRMLIVGIAGAFIGAAGEPVLAARESELIGDAGFRQGFVLNDPIPGRKNPVDILDLGNKENKPLWELSQWSSKYDLAETPPQRTSAGALSYSNKGKDVIIGGDAEGQLSMGVWGSAEYSGRARRADEPWVHLLVEQDFKEQPRVADLNSLVFRGRFRLVKSVLHKTPDYNSGIHAAQFLIYLQIRNSDLNNSGYGDYLWFGIPVYDDRYKVIPTYMNQDFAPAGNTGKFIYSPASSRYTKDAIRSGDWITLERDLLPLIRDGLLNAWKKGYLTASKDLSDYSVSYMNMGWEVPGIFDVEMDIKDLSLKATYK